MVFVSTRDQCTTYCQPDFDLAVKRHQLLDVIQKASDTGIRQVLPAD
jgi:hypothetical protein